jgi:hypothetical protein
VEGGLQWPEIGELDSHSKVTFRFKFLVLLRCLIGLLTGHACSSDFSLVCPSEVLFQIVEASEYLTWSLHSGACSTILSRADSNPIRELPVEELDLTLRHIRRSVQS